MQSVVAATRPQTDDDVVPCCHRVLAAADAAEDDAHLWKLLVLSLVRRSYHARAPEAKRVVRAKNNEKKDKKDGKSEREASSIDAGGDGEQLAFYLAVMCLA